MERTSGHHVGLELDPVSGWKFCFDYLHKLIARPSNDLSSLRLKREKINEEKIMAADITK
jgi:hypothetical protein